jgi:hypothetical protein
MLRILAALALVVGLLAACGGQGGSTPPASPPVSAASSASPSSDAASATPAAATSTPAANPTAVPSPTPAPTPTVKELAATYLKAATISNAAFDKAWATFQKSPQALADAKLLARTDAAADLVFIRAVQRIQWYGDFKTLSRKVLTYDNLTYVSERAAAISSTWAAFNANWADAGAASTKASGAANELRIALGLAPVPIK